MDDLSWAIPIITRPDTMILYKQVISEKKIHGKTCTKTVTVYIYSSAVNTKQEENKAGYTATEVACRWAGAIFEVTRPFGQEQ